MDAPPLDPAALPSRERVTHALARLGIVHELAEFPQGTRTAAEAAAAIGCRVAQIAKSIVLRAIESERCVVVIASGANRVDERKVAALLGEPLGKADAAFVRARTGYAIGGVAPVGHTGEVVLFADRDLLALDPVWAAAGTPQAVVRLASRDLARLPGVRVADVRLD